MLTVAASASDEEIKAIVGRWVECLVRGDYEAALALLYAGPESPEWTPEMLRAWIENYGTDVPAEDGRVFRVTPMEDAVLPPDLTGHAFDVDRENARGLDPAGYAGMVHFDLPLDGEWSDLTARFHIRKLGDELALELLDVHVL